MPRANCWKLSPYLKKILEDEIERVIQKGYFKSVYFRVIAALFGVALAIIGGAGGIEVFGQVREMKKLVEDARRQMEESNLEVAKARAESNNRQAELALLIMQGNEQMVKMRASAIEQMSAEELGFKSKVEAETASWASQVEKAGQDAKQEVTRAGDEDMKKEINRTAEQSTSDLHKALGMSKTVLAAKLTSTLAETEASKASSSFVGSLVYGEDMVGSARRTYYRSAGLVIQFCKQSEGAELMDESLSRCQYRCVLCNARRSLVVKIECAGESAEDALCSSTD